MITLKNVSKTLGKHLVLDNINYTFENGMVYGLCGHNGSGKTMLLRAIAGLIVPDDGEIIIDGKKLHNDISFPPNAGIVIESMELLPKYNAFDNLRLLADIKKIASDEDIRNSLERVGLNSDLKVKKFSLGMKQRLNVAQAIFEKQNIILLDEPTNALDNDGVQLIYSIIKEEKQRGATVIVATHHKEDLDELCDTILTVSEGRISFACYIHIFYMPERGRVVLNRSFMGRGLLMFGVGRILLRAARFSDGKCRLRCCAPCPRSGAPEGGLPIFSE